MKVGKISESVLKRTIIKELKYKNKFVKRGAAVGNDGVIFACTGRDMASSVATCNGELLLSVRRAFVRAVNSLAARGAEPVAVTVSLLLPETTKESELRSAMVLLNNMGESIGVQTAGGHTETAEGIREPVITVNAFGYLMKEYDRTEEKAESVAELDIVMAGCTGLEGTAVMATEREEKLCERFARSYIDRAKTFAEDMLLVKEAAVAIRHGATAMHDTSKGGVFGALWELGEYLKCGMNINLKSIPVRQETIEFCEYFDMNPYLISSGGGLLIVTKKGEELAECIRAAGKTAAVIGKTALERSKGIAYGEETRFLEMPRAGKEEDKI